MSEQIDSALLKERLQAWAEKHDIKPADFARKMDYSYNHGYQLLRGDAMVTESLLGRLVVVYGPEAAAEVAGVNGKGEA